MPTYAIVIVGAGVLAFVAGCILIWMERRKLKDFSGREAVASGPDVGGFDGGGL
ncbi:hypothetical protein G6N74_25605 [Mesorhizobium sp. CGMCC 1.15528]|uniref:Uncharacterized protein n=1 Tax=Mesorhizobium zhangyense TaxID=1776730 RepID=A0A7C9VH67_9HYPH|nr:hypothetical protein [Mesorhizobium zhangyense]NGN44451.1 hypothetical protein [Mesorhizobium zhangyense]